MLLTSSLELSFTLDYRAIEFGQTRRLLSGTISCFCVYRWLNTILQQVFNKSV